LRDQEEKERLEAARKEKLRELGIPSNLSGISGADVMDIDAL
jgi:hypothetical protein